jgi:hypothetical protein
MKQSSNSRRSRGRGSGRRQSKNQNFDSNGPDVRVRGNAQQVLDKYLSLARDAMAAGDRISSENYFQHAEHYYRILHASDESGDGGRGGRGRQSFQGNGSQPADNDATQGDSQDEAAAGQTAEAEVVLIDHTTPQPSLDVEDEPVAGEGKAEPERAADPEPASA